MKVEMLIYAYLAIAAAMIVFNIVCIFVFRRRDRRLDLHREDFTGEIVAQFSQGEPSPEHVTYLTKKLKRVNNLIAFDQTLDSLFKEYPEDVQRYVETMTPMFVRLNEEYRKKSTVKSAYYPYVLKKYRVFRGKNIKAVTDSMLELAGDANLYCRENALQVIYSIGDCRTVIDALRTVDRSGFYHHSKLICDGLLEFAGDRDELADELWRQLPSFSEKMQVTVLDYFRFSSGDHGERMLRLFLSSDRSDEAAYSCIRYFGKYHYEAAYPYLLDLADNVNKHNWEYAAIAASALEIYPGARTVESLKALLSDPNWYVRFNSSKSLEGLGLDYVDLIDIVEGSDRFAGEMIKYRLDQRKIREKEVAANANK